MVFKNILILVIALACTAAGTGVWLWTRSLSAPADESSLDPLREAALPSSSSSEAIPELGIALTTLAGGAPAKRFASWADLRAAYPQLAGLPVAQWPPQASEDLAQRLADSDLPALAAELAASDESDDFSKGVADLIIKLLEQKDPASALRIVSQNPGIFFESLAKSNLKAALEFVLSPENRLGLQESLKVLSERGESNEDFQAIFSTLVEHMPIGKSFQDAMGSLFSRWAGQDPAAAAQALSELTPGSLVVNFAARDIAWRWALDSNSTASALQWALSLPEGSTRTDSVGCILSSWAIEDPVAAAQWVQQLPENLEGRSEMMSDVAGSWARKDPLAALQWVQQLPENLEGRSGLMEGLARGWAAQDPLAVLQWVQQLPVSPKQRSQIMSGVASSWAIEDPLAAAQWVQQLPENLENRSEMMYDVAFHWVDKDPVAAMQWVQQLPENLKGRSNMIFNLAWNWAYRDPMAASQWVQQLPESLKKRRTEMMRHIAGNWAEKDPVAAMQWAQQLPENLEGRSEVMSYVVGLSAKKDPMAPLEWARRLPDNGNNLNKNIVALVEGWGRRDVEAACEWVEKLPAGATKDEAISTLSWQLLHEDPQSALDFAMGIGDVKLRDQEAITRIIHRWGKFDKAAAENWVSTAPVGEETRQRLLKKIEKPR